MANSYPGLAIGTIGYRSNSVVNVIADRAIAMGSAVQLVAQPSPELLPRVEPTDKVGGIVFGIVVQGDNDGIYGDDITPPTPNVNLAVVRAGDTVAVCTQGRCLARVEGAVVLGEGLMGDVTPPGVLISHTGTNNKTAIVLIPQAASGLTVIDFQREGI